MQQSNLVERCIVKDSTRLAIRLDEITHLAKNLYNYANYVMRESFIKQGKLVSAYTLINKFVKENQKDYRNLPAQTAQQVILLLEKNWKSFFRANKSYKANPSKFKTRPKLPGYKRKNGNSIAIFSAPKQIKQRDDRVKFPKMSGIPPLKIKTDSKIKQVRIIPQSACFIVEFVYVKEVKTTQHKPIKNSFLSLDLGLTNFITMLDNQGNTPIIVKGGVLKSINQYYNKKRAFLKSCAELSNGRKYTRKLRRLGTRRYCKIEDKLHKYSKFVIDYCLKNKLETIVIGNNQDWKQEINLGKRTNQNFVYIPYDRFLQKLQYKADLNGIHFVVTEESYTSKCDHLAYESMKHHSKYLGKRIKRGLFKSSTGVILNADVNGCIGIARKVFGDEILSLFDRGERLTPIEINPLKQEGIESIKVA